MLGPPTLPVPYCRTIISAFKLTGWRWEPSLLTYGHAEATFTGSRNSYIHPQIRSNFHQRDVLPPSNRTGEKSWLRGTSAAWLNEPDLHGGFYWWLSWLRWHDWLIEVKYRYLLYVGLNLDSRSKQRFLVVWGRYMIESLGHPYNLQEEVRSSETQWWWAQPSPCISGLFWSNRHLGTPVGRKHLERGGPTAPWTITPSAASVIPRRVTVDQMSHLSMVSTHPTGSVRPHTEPWGAPCLVWPASMTSSARRSVQASSRRSSRYVTSSTAQHTRSPAPSHRMLASCVTIWLMIHKCS